jgi:hypothetical protein
MECLQKRPRVFFEECDDPLISRIGWVAELVPASRSAARVVVGEVVVGRHHLHESEHSIEEMLPHVGRSPDTSPVLKKRLTLAGWSH